MRISLRLLCVVFAGLLTTTAFGQIDPLNSNITNSAHNLTNVPGMESMGQICLPCHVPHHAYPPEYTGDNINSVLWNHDAPNHTFTMYTTMGGTTPGQPEGTSKMCLGCHDGVTALDNYGGTTTGTILMGAVGTGSADIGDGVSADLSNDHPIGITYPTGNPGYNDPAGFAGVQLVQIGGAGPERVECSSCHEPHNDSLGKFLRRELGESLICLECHNK
ncbi:MAG: hypothetical protein JSU63_19675 [Phycisphaerales bacterium]|nr:MAG: hypothetical protein JSU63_19675 [Phycisphaerales bacterium]